MFRKSGDKMSMDIYFICNECKWHHKHVGIFSCKDNSTGENIAPHLQRVSEEYDLMLRVDANVEDREGTL
jgi:heterodisulfide reductase subunit B